MAFGLECGRCGYTETAHAFSTEYPGACHRYVSPDVVDLPRDRRSDDRRPSARGRQAAVIPFGPRKRVKKVSAA
jgi:hypothetical protein